ncbi:MAG: ThuA domain-containing protein [Lentisphaerales bacterium]|nr:ThuA domain-containing protein [Lentisphaerales bacterium]
MFKNLPNALCVFLLIALVTPALAQKKRKLMEITPEIRKKLKKALPSEVAKPKAKRKVLVFSKSSGFLHTSTSVGNELLKLMASETGAFEITINEDPSTYTDEYLKQFDCIVVNNATYIDKAFKGTSREAFLNFIKNGGNYVGIHAASDGGKKAWPEYSEMVGGQFDGHPWNAAGKWAMEVNDTANPINKPFPEKLFIFQDEIYRQSGPYKKSAMHTLLKIDPVNDPLKVKEGEQPSKKKVTHHREYPISWIKDYGKGKVFYTCFGHRAETYYVPKIVDHMLRGIQWSLGDLEAEMILGK